VQAVPAAAPAAQVAVPPATAAVAAVPDHQQAQFNDDVMRYLGMLAALMGLQFIFFIWLARKVRRAEGSA
jgi:hypothetical protein